MNPAAVGVGSYSTALVLQHDALPSLTNVSVSVSFSINSADLSISVPAISFASPFSLDATLVANVLINSNGTLPLQLLGISVTDSSWLMASFVDLTLHSSATASLLSGMLVLSVLWFMSKCRVKHHASGHLPHEWIWCWPVHEHHHTAAQPASIGHSDEYSSRTFY